MACGSELQLRHWRLDSEALKTFATMGFMKKQELDLAKTAQNNS
jgi:hypothetical protein